MILLFSTSTSPTFNLATEEYLFAERQDDLLFLYVNEPSVIIGCNQAIRNEVDLEFCSENNIQIVRRLSGGGAVYHDLGNLNFCFISNKTAGESSLNDEFLKPIIAILTELGIPVEIGKRKDLWLDRIYKISGTASHVTKNRELHHGTLLYDTNLEMLEETLSSKKKDESAKAISSVPSKVKNLRTYFKENEQVTLNAVDFFDLFKDRLIEIYKFKIENILSEVEIEKIQLLVGEKYTSKNWTYKK
jgi:lipoate-protein ligase A